MVGRDGVTHAYCACRDQGPSAVGWVTPSHLLGVGHRLRTPGEGGPEGEQAAQALLPTDTTQD